MYKLYFTLLLTVFFVSSSFTSLNSAEADTIFDSISNSETKKIARVAMEVSSLSEILKGYLAGANDPKYRFN